MTNYNKILTKILAGIILLSLPSCKDCISYSIYTQQDPVNIYIVYENLEGCNADTCKNFTLIKITEGTRDTLCVSPIPKEKELFGTDCVVNIKIPGKWYEKTDTLGTNYKDTFIVIHNNIHDIITGFSKESKSDYSNIKCTYPDNYYYFLLNGKKYSANTIIYK